MAAPLVVLPQMEESPVLTALLALSLHHLALVFPQMQTAQRAQKAPESYLLRALLNLLRSLPALVLLPETPKWLYLHQMALLLQ